MAENGWYVLLEVGRKLLLYSMSTKPVNLIKLFKQHQGQECTWNLLVLARLVKEHINLPTMRCDLLGWLQVHLTGP